MTPTLTKITPIIAIDSIEPCLAFWTEGLGFEVTVTVPHEDTIGFAILQKGGLELMYQTRASIEADLGASGAPKALGKELAASTSTLFVEVERLDDVIAALGDQDVVVPRRKTFYGMDEIFVRAPCGTLVGLAARVG
jgi:uncharacterized glyoxalase superfamily protein PhnB